MEIGGFDGGPRLRETALVAGAAARLVRLAVAHLHQLLATRGALGEVRGLSADDADRVHLVDELGEREQRRHRAERTAEEVLIEAGDDDAHASIGELGGEIDQAFVEELRLVDADHLYLGQQRGAQLPAVANRKRGDLPQVTRDDALGPVADVGGRLEDLDLLACDESAPEPAQQLFALPENIPPAMISIWPAERSRTSGSLVRMGAGSYQRAPSAVPRN